MKRLLAFLILFASMTQARAETGDSDDWSRIKSEVESNPSSIASFDRLHLWKDGWKSVHRADHAAMHIYEHRNAAGNYVCDIKENGNLNMQHIVSATPCADIVIK